MRWLLSICVGWTILAGSLAVAQPLAGYLNFAQLTTELRRLDAEAGVTLESLGTTLGGREIWLLTLSAAENRGKPALLLVGNVHAPHLAGSELALRTARQLLEKSRTDEPTRQLLERFTIHILPRPNPDATEATFAPPYFERTGNERSTDDDRDFKFDEDPPEDLNGDGWITQMRIEDPAGRFMPHPADDRVLIEADPKKNEAGRWRLLSEGIDNDGDEAWNEDGPGGVDFNRNFTFQYPFFRAGAGPHQVSEVETRGVAEFCFQHPEIVAVFTFTPEENLFEPWKPGGDERIKTNVLSADADAQNYLAEQYRLLHGGKDCPSMGRGEGAFGAWAYFHYGRWSLGARGWWIPKTDPPKPDPPAEKPSDKPADKPADKPTDEKRGAEDLNALRWFAAKGIEGFVPWKPIEHTDFPGKRVEVGGFKPLLRLNPPVAELDGLADKHRQYLLKLADWMPRVQLDDLRVEPLGRSLFRVQVRTINRGFLPTMSAMGRLNREAYPLQIELKLPEGARLLTASPRVTLDPLSGSGGVAETTWMVDATQAKATAATIRVWAPSVGRDERKLELTDKPQ